MISRKDVLKLGGAGMFGAAIARASSLVAAAAAPGDGDLRRLTTADLRKLPLLVPPDGIAATGRVRRFTLTLARARVSPLAGHSVTVPAIDGRTPGPVIRATEGDDVEIAVVNELPQGASIHWHGIPVPFAMDGASSISQAPIAPHSQFTYRWTAPQAGTYMYHSHFHDLEQTTIAGMIVIDPQQPVQSLQHDLDVPIAITTVPWEVKREAEEQAVLADSMDMPSMAGNPKSDPTPNMGDAMDRMDMVEYWCFNGKTFPSTQPIDVKPGALVRLRFANLTGMTHPIHLHGHWFRWIAQDGNPLTQPQIMNTVAVNPGQTIDIDFLANNPGVWPLHCHIVAHMVDNRDTMSGLMTVVRYEGFALPPMMM